MDKVDCWYIPGGPDEAEHRAQARELLERVAPEYRGECVRLPAKELNNRLASLGWKPAGAVALLALVGREGKVIKVLV